MSILSKIQKARTSLDTIELNRDQKKSFLLILLILFTVAYPLLSPVHTQASVVATAGLLRLDRMAASATTGGTVCMKPINTHTSTNSSVVVTFPGTGTQSSTSFGVNTTAANWTVTTTNMPVISGTTATAWPSIATANAVSTNSVTFPTSGTATLTAGIYYCFNFSGTSTLTNPTAATTNSTATITATDTSAPASEVTTYATSIITSPNDQLIVTGTVGATFSFTQTTAGSQALGALPTTNAATGSTTVYTVSTNAHNGWIAWLKSTTGTLHSTGAGADIPASNLPAYVASGSNLIDLTGTGVSQYVIDSIQTSGSTADAAYKGVGSYDGGRPDTKFEPFSSDASAASGDQFGVQARARISATQAAATDYTDTLTIVAAGQF